MGGVKDDNSGKLARMKCPACGFTNDIDDIFCGGCGVSLVRRCTHCDTELKPGRKFCTKCGAETLPFGSAEAPRDIPVRRVVDYTPKHLADKILQSKSALEGERKQVTVLFADIQGSMNLATQLDPEQWHGLLERYFAILTDAVHRFEGTVNQYTGDGIMALFGAPIAHEDHAQRACYAALEARDHLHAFADDLRVTRGLNFSFRIGLNSGDVVVGKIGDDLRMDYTAQGATVGIAQRIEQLAAPGHVYLSGATERLVAGYFQVRSMGETSLKGLVDAMALFELQSTTTSRTRIEVAITRGLSQFVGRSAEMQALDAALARAESVQGQVIGIVGEPGLGKSRLCFEFVERCRRQGLPVFEAHCPAHGKNIPYLPILELFRHYFGIIAQDDAQASRQRIAGALVLLDPALQDTLPVLFEFMGVSDPKRPPPPMDAGAKQRQLYEMLHRITRAHDALGHLTVTLIDDLHWIDAGSDAFIEQLVNASAGRRSLLVLNFRPEYVATFANKPHYQQLPLAPLGAAALRELLAGLIGRDDSVSELIGRIVEWTTGNPFYTEELVNALVEAGDLVGLPGHYRLVTALQRLRVPTNVRDVLAARIDRLPETAKRLLQCAAVIGKEFTGPLLDAVTDLAPSEQAAALQRLKAGDFIYERALYPVFEYAFKHPLTHEVAYHSQLQSRRAVIHAAVARALEAQAGDKLDELAALLAHHYEEADEALEAARWHRRAARWTEDTDPSDSIRRCHRVRALLAGVVESAETIGLRIEACRGILSAAWRVGGSDVDLVFAEGKTLAERSGDLRSVAILLNVYGNAKGSAGDLRAYHQHSLQALRAAESAGDPVLLAALASDAHAFCYTGRLNDAVRLTEQAIALGPEDLSLGRELFGVSAFLLGSMFRGMALVEMGRLEEAASELDRASSHPAEQPTPFIWAQAWHVVRAYRFGDAPGALAHARRTVERAEGVGDTVTKVLAHTVLGIALVANDEWDAAEKAEREALATARQSGVGFGITAWAVCFLAEVMLGRNDNRAALEMADAALSEARQNGGRLFEMDALLVRARALLRCAKANAAAEAQRTLVEVCALIDETGAHSRGPVVHETAAEIARSVGDTLISDQLLRQAEEGYEQIGALGHAQRLAAQRQVLSV